MDQREINRGRERERKRRRKRKKNEVEKLRQLGERTTRKGKRRQRRQSETAVESDRGKERREGEMWACFPCIMLSFGVFHSFFFQRR